MTLSEKGELIIRDIKKEKGNNPFQIFKHMAEQEYVSMHGPEHHVLDGASILVAYKNAGGRLDLDASLEKIKAEGLRMPGAMCGLWGVCGAVSSIGAALAIIDKTGPLSSDGTWGEHMKYTSRTVNEMGNINGPRCCKRDAHLAFNNAVVYIKEHYGIELEQDSSKCNFHELNMQCIKERCPYYE